MFDFSWTVRTLDNVLYCIAIYVLFLLLYYRKYVTNALVQSTKPDNSLISAALVLVVSACIDGDWFHYEEMVHNYDFSSGARNYGEPVYYYIIRAVNKNYLLFRIIVWGGALWLTYMASKRFGINPNIAIFFLIAVFLIRFNYARASLGMASYFLGLSYLLKPAKISKLTNCLLVVLFLGAAYTFHHSLIILILLTVTAFLPLAKPIVIIVMLICLPLSARLLVDNFILVDDLGNEYFNEKRDRYLERENVEANFWGIIALIISYGVFVITVILDIIALYKNRRMVSETIFKLFCFTLSVLFLSLSFLFMGLNSNVFFYRILFMSFIPLTIITVYLLEKRMISKKQYRLVVLWGILNISYKLLTSFFHYI